MGKKYFFFEFKGLSKKLEPFFLKKMIFRQSLLKVKKR